MALGLGLWCLCHFQQYFSFIGGGSRSTRRKPPTCHKSLTNFITWWHLVTKCFFI